jgi:hypothetical protein
MWEPSAGQLPKGHLRTASATQLPSAKSASSAVAAVPKVKRDRVGVRTMTKKPTLPLEGQIGG